MIFHVYANDAFVLILIWYSMCMPIMYSYLSSSFFSSYYYYQHHHLSTCCSRALIIRWWLDWMPCKRRVVPSDDSYCLSCQYTCIHTYIQQHNYYTIITTTTTNTTNKKKKDIVINSTFFILVFYFFPSFLNCMVRLNT